MLAFLDSDDLWAPTKLERQLAALRANPECGWSYTAFVMVDADGTPLPSERSRPWTPHSGQIFTQTVRTTASIRPSSVLASTALVREAGAFDEAIDCSEDYDLWLRLALRSPVCVVDEPLISVRRHSSNPKRRAGAPHLARDYSLRKLAAQLDGARAPAARRGAEPQRARARRRSSRSRRAVAFRHGGLQEPAARLEVSALVVWSREGARESVPRSLARRALRHRGALALTDNASRRACALAHAAAVRA